MIWALVGFLVINFLLPPVQKDEEEHEADEVPQGPPTGSPASVEEAPLPGWLDHVLANPDNFVGNYMPETEADVEDVS